MKLLKNKKGFTLIELLAVIVILAVLMMLAIPSMTKLIETSRKKTYVTTAQGYINQARMEAFSDIYPLPEIGEYIIVPVMNIDLESGQQKSPFGSSYVENQSYVVIVNDGVPADSATGTTKYFYFAAMLDQLGNGLELKEENSIVAADIFRNNRGANIKVGSSSGFSGGLSSSDLQAACPTCAFTQSTYSLKYSGFKS